VTLSVQRKSTFPLDGDDWQTIAAREFADQPEEQAVSNLQSWNLHVFMRRVTGKESHERTSEILPSDVIFLEPPSAG
tara:strand:+ start:918 stop:1148 length:231 start_codon:yes stop_codon:yes gene_type:complete